MALQTRLPAESNWIANLRTSKPKLSEAPKDGAQPRKVWKQTAPLAGQRNTLSAHLAAINHIQLRTLAHLQRETPASAIDTVPAAAAAKPQISRAATTAASASPNSVPSTPILESNGGADASHAIRTWALSWTSAISPAGPILEVNSTSSKSIGAAQPDSVPNTPVLEANASARKPSVLRLRDSASSPVLESNASPAKQRKMPTPGSPTMSPTLERNSPFRRDNLTHSPSFQQTIAEITMF